MDCFALKESSFAGGVSADAALKWLLENLESPTLDEEAFEASRDGKGPDPMLEAASPRGGSMLRWDTREEQTDYVPG